MPLNPLRKYLMARRKEQAHPSKGDPPKALKVIRFGAFAVEGARLGCGDPSQLPLGVSVNSGPGSYELEAECLVYAGDARVGRVSAQRTASKAKRGDRVGQIGVDLAMACFFDAERLEAFADDKPDDYVQWVEDDVVMCDWVEAGTLSCRPAKTKIPSAVVPVEMMRSTADSSAAKPASDSGLGNAKLSELLNSAGASANRRNSFRSFS